MSSAYKMPRAYLGQVVLWRHSRAAVEPAPALVTRTGQGAISVLIFPTDSRVGIVRDGVRHAGDPGLATVQSDSGVWDFNEADAERIPRDLFDEPARPAKPAAATK